jgi:hypothetical protein
MATVGTFSLVFSYMGEELRVFSSIFSGLFGNTVNIADYIAPNAWIIDK